MTTTKAAMAVINGVEDGLRWFSPNARPYWLFTPLWKARGWLSSGKKRRLLERFIREWAKNGERSQDFFYYYDHKLKHREGEMIVVTVEWKERFK